MKQLYLIGGPMGVGKTTVCQALKRCLERSVFLDGDWCWDANPFQVTEETKAMVLDNITFLLNRFLRCSAYDHVIFCWVLHEQAILDEILSRIQTTGEIRIHAISLISDEASLRQRLERDVELGVRLQDVIARSLAYLPKYNLLDTVKIDTSGKTADEVVRELIGEEKNPERV